MNIQEKDENSSIENFLSWYDFCMKYGHKEWLKKRKYEEKNKEV